MKIENKDFGNPVVVLGNSSTNSLGVIRAYGRRGIPVWFIHTDYKQTASNSSKYVLKIIRLERWNPNLLKEALLDLELNDHEKIVVIPTNDASLIAYSSIKNSLPGIFVDCLAPNHLIELFVDKSKFYHFLKEENIPHPNTYDLIHFEKTFKKCDKFPFALKPIYSYQFEKTFDGKKLFRIDSENDFKNHQNLLDKKEIKAVIQEIIPGNRIYIVYFFITKQGKVSVICGYDKIRQSPQDYGTASMVACSWNDELINKTICLAQKLGYTGIGEAEYKYDPQDGEYKLLEINARSTNQNRFIPYLGADIELLYYLDALDCPIPIDIPMMRNSGIKWIDFQKDLRTLFYMDKSNGFSFYQFFKSYQKVKVDGYFAKDDLKPFVLELTELLRAGLKKFSKNS